MCDILIKTNIPKNEQPEFVYKRVQKIGEGKYISAVMGEPMKMGVWKTAPKRKNIRGNTGSLFKVLFKLRNPKNVRLNYMPKSSAFEEHHNGKWAVFKHWQDAHYSSMVSNFRSATNERLPTVIVKCQMGGTVHASRWDYKDTFLCSAIKIVEEISQKA